MKTLQTGIIIKTVGLKGEVKVKSTTYFAAKRYKRGNAIFLSKDGKGLEKFTVKSYRNYQGFDYLTINGIDSIEIAEKYIGYDILINKEDAELEKGMYYFDDLETCNVYDNATKALLGNVEKVDELPAHITLIVRSEKSKKLFYIPFIEVFVGDVDIANKAIYINVIEGLID